MQQPHLSLVIPAYNNGAFLAATIDSILEQDFSDYELIISDHASADNTLEIAQSYADDRIRVVQCPAGGGAGANWNFVSSLAHGKLFKLVCGDDLLLPGALTAQTNALSEYPEASMVASRRTFVDARGDAILSERGVEGLQGYSTGADALRATVRSGTNIFGEPGSVMMRRSAFERGGAWDAREQYLIDMSGYVSALRHGGCVALPEAHAVFRLSATQWSTRLVQQQYQQTQAFFNRLQYEFPHAISSADLRLGNTKAYGLAYARRAVYRLLGARMGGDNVERTT